MTRSTTSRLHAAIAASVDAPVSLIGVLPDLFRDLDSLGSVPDSAIALLGRAGIAARHRVLDLACGKGAVAVEMAAQLRCRVLGVDAFRPFVEAARRAARARGVGARCRFRVGDAGRFRAARPYDGAVMLGLFPVDRAAPLLRGLVRRGGVYLIDDAFLDERWVGARRVPGVPGLREARGIFGALGDAVIEEHVPTHHQIRTLDAGLYGRLASRAKEIAVSRPRLAPALRRFLANQRRANRLMQGPIRPAVWVVRRGR